MISTHFSDHLWSIVLADREEERATPLIEQGREYSHSIQYGAAIGSCSMHQHTLAWANQVTTPTHQITVVGRHHQQSPAVVEGTNPGTILLQPQNCDTAAGLFLPLTYIRAQNPYATVVVFPSDYFVFSEGRVVSTVQQAIRATRNFHDRIILLGIRPTSFDLDDGWIETGGPLTWDGELNIRRVHTIIQKPPVLKGLYPLLNGGLWNTGILAAKAETLWRLGWKCIPEVMEPFQRLECVIGTLKESQTLEAIYHEMPKRNFSSNLLACVPESIGVIELQDVLWSDRENPEPIVATLRVLGKEPAFSGELIKTHEPVER